MPRILTGIQPSGTLHIGNYLGAMRPAIDLQDKGEAFYFIADYHALTTVRDGQALRGHVLRVATDFLACGLDPAKACLFVQSDVPAVTELSWILSTVTPMSLLEKCHSYKDKTAQGIAADHGLFAYPVLMAADILLYDSDLVPVGRDQKQHVEVTRDIAIKINQQYGEILKLPHPVIRDEVAIIPGLDGRKMSKSYLNTIDLFLEEKALLKIIKQLKTDSTPVEAPKDPTQSSIVTLYRHFAMAEDVTRMENDFQQGGVGYGEFKNRLFEAVRDHFRPFAEKRTAILAEKDYVEKILAEGRERAQSVASVTLRRVREAVGLKR